MSKDRPGSPRSVRLHVVAGLAVIVLVATGVAAWASTTLLAGALVAQGTIVVDSNVKKVQHPTGGVVSELFAHDGVEVKAGDVVLRLDGTSTRANLAIVVKGLNGLWARAARLDAEQRGAEYVTFQPELLDQLADDEVKNIVGSEVKLFRVRLSSRLGQVSQLRQRIAQLHEEIGGLTAQEIAKAREIELVEKELTGVRDLYNQQLVQISRFTALERDAARLAGERAQFASGHAQAKGKISETELKIIQVEKDFVSEVSKDLRETNDKIGEFVERKITAEDQLRRSEIRAPQDGMVQQSIVHTVGGVINAGEVLMMIVPQADKLSVEARINPQDIDKLQVGQNTVLRFSAFNQRTTPELRGAVTRVAPDTTIDQRTGQTYYTVRISIPPEEIATLGGLRLVPGMPVEAFVQTGERTMLAYLAKPFSDQLMRAFREK